MKQDELIKHANCSMCGEKILKSGLPLFWRVKIERFALDIKAIQRQHGLSMMIGNPVIAAAMGPDEDMANPVMEATTITICETCCTKSTCVGHLAEIGAEANPD